jgi:hypothetical protein
MMLNALAGTEAPLARFDIDAAMARGLRGRRMRRARTGGSVFAIGAVIGMAVAVLVVPGPAKAPATTPQVSSTAPVTSQPTTAPGHVPRQFNPLVPYASFGWLPAGLAMIGAGQTENSNDATTLAASSKQGSFWLHVMATGGCGYIRTMLNCHWDSGSVTGPLPLNDRAPAVNGRPAYWTGPGSITWEYAAGAWATLGGGMNGTSTSADRALLHKVAAGVRYGYQTPLVFPFWVGGLPAGWQPSTSYFTGSRPPVQASGLDLGPAEKPQAAQINVGPASGNSGCMFQKGDSYVTLDGVKGIVQGSSFAQMLCISDLHGQAFTLLLSLQYFSNGVRKQVPGAASLGGVVALFKHLHLLGSQVSAWTTEPFR